MSTKLSTMVRSKYNTSNVKHGHYKKKPKQVESRSTSEDDCEDSVVPTLPTDKKKRTHEERLRRERLSKGYKILRQAIGAKNVSNNECLLKTIQKIDYLHKRRAKATKKLWEQNKILAAASINSWGEDNLNAEDEEYITCSDDEDSHVDVESIESDSNGSEYSKHMNSVLIKGVSEICMKHIDEESESSDSDQQ